MQAYQQVRVNLINLLAKSRAAKIQSNFRAFVKTRGIKKVKCVLTRARIISLAALCRRSSHHQQKYHHQQARARRIGIKSACLMMRAYFRGCNVRLQRKAFRTAIAMQRMHKEHSQLKTFRAQKRAAISIQGSRCFNEAEKYQMTRECLKKDPSPSNPAAHWATLELEQLMTFSVSPRSVRHKKRNPVDDAEFVPTNFVEIIAHPDAPAAEGPCGSFSPLDNRQTVGYIEEDEARMANEDLVHHSCNPEPHGAPFVPQGNIQTIWYREQDEAQMARESIVSPSLNPAAQCALFPPGKNRPTSYYMPALEKDESSVHRGWRQTI